LLLTTCERAGGFSAFGVGTSALMAHTRNPRALRRHIGSKDRPTKS
jgi:hypothetical protein